MLAKDTTPIVSLRDVSKQFYLADGSAVPVLHHINLEIFPGEMIAILGQSGSGKSTLMNIIGGLDVVSAGEYYFAGQNVGQFDEGKLAEMRSRDISFIFQSFHLLPGKTIYQNVRLPLLYQTSFTGSLDIAVKTALGRAALEEAQWYKRPNQLSGGQRQRAAIARALVSEPRLLLADEPTGNLDSKTGDTIIDALKMLNKTFNTTIVIVTHDESLISEVERVVRIKDGCIKEDTKV